MHVSGLQNKGGFGRLLLLLLFSPAVSAGFIQAPEASYIQGSLVFGQVEFGTSVQVAKRKLRLDAQGRFVFGLGRDAKDETITLIEADGSKSQHKIHVQKREYKTQRIDGLPPSKVTPKPEVYTQIKEDIRLAKLARKDDLPNQDVLKGFVWPAIGPISGVYGSQRVLNGVPKRPHFGVDVAGPTGQEVYAPAGGVVTLVRDMYYSGLTMIIDHGFGVSSSMLHLHKAHVKQGQRIEQGELIAEIGATGRATGPHLDWRMNWFKRRVDPQLLVGEMPKQEK